MNRRCGPTHVAIRAPIKSDPAIIARKKVRVNPGPSNGDASFPDQPYDLARLYETLVDKGRIVGYEVTERLHEIGSPASLDEAREHLGKLSSSLFSRLTNFMSYTQQYLAEAAETISRLDHSAIERMVTLLAEVRGQGGRLFILGVGGSAANASHAVNDFRKLAGIEAYAPTDNAAELTARTNDEGWENVFADWLAASRLRAEDAILVFSVGGGDLQRNISPNLVRGLEYGKKTAQRSAGSSAATGAIRPKWPTPA